MEETELLGRYLDNLAQENRQLERMLVSGQGKQMAIVSNDVDGLDRIVQEETGFLRELRALEAGRKKLQADLAGIWGLSHTQSQQLNSVTVLSILTDRDNKVFRSYQEMIGLIKKNMRRLQDLNKENQELTALALEYIDDIQLLLLGEENAGLYSGEGEAVVDMPRPSLKLLDRKI
jgi:hypothetical protein